MGRSRRPRSHRPSIEGAAALARRGRRAVLAVTAVLAAGCAAMEPGSETARAWGQGPARWLLLPDEQAELEGLRDADLPGFLQRFWRRRDDDPSTPEVPFAAVYTERVAAADSLYAEEGMRGSLTDRGGALLLLGPPSILRTAQQRSLTWGGAKPPPGARPTRLVKLEIWAYHPDDLSPDLRGLMGLGWEGREVAVTFQVGARQTRLVEGRDLLLLAARALLHEPPEGVAQ